MDLINIQREAGKHYKEACLRKHRFVTGKGTLGNVSRCNAAERHDILICWVLVKTHDESGTLLIQGLHLFSLNSQKTQRRGSSCDHHLEPSEQRLWLLCPLPQGGFPPLWVIFSLCKVSLKLSEVSKSSMKACLTMLTEPQWELG